MSTNNISIAFESQLVKHCVLANQGKFRRFIMYMLSDVKLYQSSLSGPIINET